MKKRNLFAVGILTALLLTGCSGSDSSETESLKQQIAQLEQQVAELQAVSDDSSAENTPSADGSSADGSLAEQPASGDSAQTSDASAADALTTTNTMEELTALVTDYVEKAKAASPDGTASENMEQFFTLKQEEHQIDDALDLHEDELEYMYRQNALTRDEYKKLERELEQLEDQLDDAEDWLERTFGIDD